MKQNILVRLNQLRVNDTAVHHQRLDDGTTVAVLEEGKRPLIDYMRVRYEKGRLTKGIMNLCSIFLQL